MTDRPPVLDLERSRQLAQNNRTERVQAIDSYESHVRKAAEKKRDYRTAKGQAFLTALKDNGVTAAAEIAKDAAADAEYEAELSAGLVGVARERVSLAADDRAMLRHFSERSAELDKWGGSG